MREELMEGKAMDAAADDDSNPTGFTENQRADEEEDDEFPIKLPDGLTEEQLKDFSRKRKADHKRWFGDANGYNEQIMQWWKAYAGKQLPGATGGNVVPLSNSVIETDTAKTYQALFSRAKVVDAQPRTPQADNENKTTVEDLLNQELLFGLSRTGEKAFDIVKALKIEGTGFARVKWEKRFIETIAVPMQKDLSNGQMVAMKTVAEAKMFRTVHGPDFDGVPVQNCIWDHRVGTRAQESEFFCESQFHDITDLLIMQEKGTITNVDAIQRLPGGEKIETGNPDQKRKQQLGPGGAGPNVATEVDPEKRVDEWFGWVPYQEPQPDGSKKWSKVSLHWMIVNDEVLVMCEANPWVDEEGHGPNHPFLSYRQSVQPRELLGKGVLAPIMDMQMYVNSLHDSMGKLTKKAAKNPTFVSRAAGIDTLRMYQDELALIPVMDPDKIKYHPIDGGQLEAVSKERGWGINFARETVAANEQAQGVATGNLSNATATEASIINANSGTRFQLIVDQLGFEFFAALANLYWWMIRQWAQEGDLVVRESSIDGAPRPITRAHLTDDYFFVPITSSVLNDQRAQLQAKMQFAQQMAQLQNNPAAMQDADGESYHFDLIDFVIKELMPLMGVRNGRSYMKKLLPQLQQQGLLPGGPGAPGGPATPGGGAPPPGTIPPPAALPPHPGVPGTPPRGPLPPGMMPRLAPPALAPQPGFGPQGSFRA